MSRRSASEDAASPDGELPGATRDPEPALVASNEPQPVGVWRSGACGDLAARGNTKPTARAHLAPQRRLLLAGVVHDARRHDARLHGDSLRGPLRHDATRCSRRRLVSADGAPVSAHVASCDTGAPPFVLSANAGGNRAWRCRHRSRRAAVASHRWHSHTDVQRLAIVLPLLPPSAAHRHASAASAAWERQQPGHVQHAPPGGWPPWAHARTQARRCRPLRGTLRAKCLQLLRGLYGRVAPQRRLSPSNHDHRARRRGDIVQRVSKGHEKIAFREIASFRVRQRRRSRRQYHRFLPQAQAPLWTATVPWRRGVSAPSWWRPRGARRGHTYVASGVLARLVGYGGQ
mmetsp:Transcript_48209/g.134549  ORF Transcript_48209/g.134549 Transcript_48209/m.134549 type:complete len:345 (+) Transcript_48209:208-1242(+)